MQTRAGIVVACLLALAASGCAGIARDGGPTAEGAGQLTLGVASVHLDVEYWVRRQARRDELLLDGPAIAAQNVRLRESDASVNDLERLPLELPRARVREWVEELSKAPAAPLFDAEGARVTPGDMAALHDSLALEAILVRQPTRFGLVTRRADLRKFPTSRRMFNTAGETDIDRFQESAFFPGTPVAIVHASRDGEWWFVVGKLYEAWIEKRFVAVGDRAQVLAYGRRAPYVVITGADERTTYTPAQPQVSELGLDMGVRMPVLADWPSEGPVNGQHPIASHVIELPVRSADGRLDFAPALLPRRADAARGYLPMTRAAILRQGFKFLGERYGWGHSYNARDCSGFVAEVYRSFGVTLPRNTGDQAASPALHRMVFDAGMDHAARLARLRTLEVGDLVYVPGHVMMVIGHEGGLPWVIHDTAGINHRNRDGVVERVAINGVAVTPLVPLMSDGTTPLIDRITVVQRMRR